MSIWKDYMKSELNDDAGRFEANVKWVGQLLHNGGVYELQCWLAEQDQPTKDDIIALLDSITTHVKSECQQTVSEAEIVVTEPNHPQIWEPLRLVKNYNDGDYYTSD